METSRPRSVSLTFLNAPCHPARARPYEAQRNSWRLRCGGDSIGALRHNSFKLALVQMLVEGGRKEANLRRAIERIQEAAASGAQVMILPEAMTLGWTHSSAKRDAEEIPGGDCCLRLREAARASRRRENQSDHHSGGQQLSPGGNSAGSMPTRHAVAGKELAASWPGQAQDVLDVGRRACDDERAAPCRRERRKSPP